jgi:hypothetical protein
MRDGYAFGGEHLRRHVVFSAATKIAIVCAAFASGFKRSSGESR